MRAHVAAKEAGLRLVVGSRLALQDAPDMVCYPTDRAAWGRLCRLLTLGKSRAPKGECRLCFEDVLAHAEGQILLVVPPPVLGRHLPSGCGWRRENCVTNSTWRWCAATRRTMQSGCAHCNIWRKPPA